MQQAHCIGTVKGPGETPHEFTFIAPDPERRVNMANLFTIWPMSMAKNAKSWGVLRRAISVKLFPDSFMADPAVPPNEIAALLGYDSDANELFEITVAVLGYHSRAMGDFINPRGTTGWWFAHLYCRR